MNLDREGYLFRKPRGRREGDVYIEPRSGTSTPMVFEEPYEFGTGSRQACPTSLVRLIRGVSSSDRPGLLGHRLRCPVRHCSHTPQKEPRAMMWSPRLHVRDGAADALDDARGLMPEERRVGRRRVLAAV